MHRMTVVSALLAIILADAADAQRPLVHHVSLRGQIQLEHSRIVERAFNVADRDGAAAVVLELDVAGGSAQAAQLIVQHVERALVPSVAWVKRAWGAGAMIALATDTMLVTPSSSIGADPTGSTESATLSEPAMRALVWDLRRLVQRRGADPNLGEAMVNPSSVIDGLVESGELLTLNGDQAIELGLATAVVSDLDGVLERVQLEDADVVPLDAGYTATTVKIANRNSRDIRVFLVRSTNRYRLGTVTSFSDREFTVPENLLVAGSTIRTQVEVIGSSESVSTDPIRVEPGLVIEWVIETSLSRSNYFVWIR
jgi:membrane-bound ClpP family serine protease